MLEYVLHSIFFDSLCNKLCRKEHKQARCEGEIRLINLNGDIDFLAGGC